MIEFVLEVEHGAYVRLVVDVTGNMFGAGFCDENTADMNLEVVSKYIELEITRTHKTEVECIHVLRPRCVTLDAIAFVVAHLVEGGGMKRVNVCRKHVQMYVDRAEWIQCGDEQQEF